MRSHTQVKIEPCACNFVKFSLNPNLDINKLRDDFSKDQRLRIDNFLPDHQAQELSLALSKLQSYRHAFVLDGKYGEATSDELRAISQAERNRFINDLMGQAANGVGFWYERHEISVDDEGVLQDLHAWLNGRELLEAIGEITKVSGYKSAMAQATRFQRGDFLTRHKDVVTEQKRKTAFVINLPRQWHPDWGGLLQFFEENGTLRDAWNPDFNSLSLFDVSHIHSVTSVSSFAPQPRLAVSGWFQTG